MKGKKYTTEDKIRILREADAGKGILELCRELKALSPAHRREFAKQAVERKMCSKRAACRNLRLARSTYGWAGLVSVHAADSRRPHPGAGTACGSTTPWKSNAPRSLSRPIRAHPEAQRLC